MSEPTRPNAALVRRIYQGFADRDVPAVLGLIAPDVEIRQSAEVPWGGTYSGHAEALEFFGKLTTVITSAVTVDHLVDAGDTVVAIGWTRGTVNGTGAPFDVPIAHAWTFRDGLAVRVAFYIDNPTMRAALDAR